MTQAWFDAAAYAWIPGTAYGVLTAAAGAVVALLAARGRARRFVFGTWTALWFAALALLIVGEYARQRGQPWGIWYGFLLPGVIGVSVVGANFLTLLKWYRGVEQRRLAARDL
jgi:uncharacterized membrane protein